MPSVNSQQMDQLIFDTFHTVIPDKEAYTIKGIHDAEALRVLDFFSGKRWEDVSLQKLRTEYIGDASACLYFMPDVLARYYLPAYMHISIQEYKDADMIVESVIGILMPKKQNDKEFIAWADGFTPAQQKVINLFLHYMEEMHHDDFLIDGPDVALTRYWSKFD